MNLFHDESVQEKGVMYFLSLNRMGKTYLKKIPHKMWTSVARKCWRL